MKTTFKHLVDASTGKPLTVKHRRPLPRARQKFIRERARRSAQGLIKALSNK